MKRIKDNKEFGNMSCVSFMDRLLDGIAVEWKKLEDIFHLKNGYTPSKTNKDYWKDGTVPWFRMEDIRDNGRILNDSLQKISISAIKGGKLFPKNSIIIATSATIGEHALITVPYLANQRFTNLSLKNNYKCQFNIKFLFYYCFLLSDWCKKNTTMSSFASVDMNGFRKFPIPIPCPETPEKSLKIQAEIVRILDTFTALTAELTAELTARKRQYNYYRDKLLHFGPEIKWKALRKVAEYSKSRINFKKIDCNNYTGVDNLLPNRLGRKESNYVPTTGNFTEYNRDDVLIGNIRPYLKKIWYADRTGGTNGDVLVIHPTDNTINSRYLYYILSDEKFFEYNMQHAKGAKMPRGNKMKILDYIIPIPPLEEQARIVAILDKFDTLTHSISKGLPKEIALRKKQYEYYRDLLLSFPKPEAAT